MDLAHTSRYWTSYRASKVVVFEDIDFSEHVRIEVRGVRKLGENPVLASLDFEVHDVMGLGLREDASKFQLECDQSRVRSGDILLAFDFDPPVPADVLVALEQETPLCWSESDRCATREVDDPVYINVAGNFACLLLDDDEPQNAPQSWQEKGLAPDDLLITNLTRHHCGRRQLSDGSRSNRHRRSSPLGAVNLAQQLALSLSGREVGNEGINGSVSSGRSKQFKLPSRLTYSRSPTRRQPTGNSTAAAATPAPASTTASVKPADGPNRNPRSRSKPPKVKIAEDCSHGLSKMRRPRSWTSGILKSPTLSNSFSRAWHAGAVVNHRTRGRSRADTEENCGGGSGAGGGRRGTAVDAAVAALAHDAEQSTSMFMSYDIRSAFDSPTSDYSYQP